MDNVAIRLATVDDVRSVVAIYESAKAYMRRSGNMKQWLNGYPGENEVRKDIADGNLYVGEDSERGAIEFVFAFILGVDPTYNEIDGAWLNNEPYGTVHRIASAGRHGGAVERCVEFCLKSVSNIRIDTHSDNAPMLAALGRAGFSRCGVIICSDGTPREAFQLTAP